MTINPFAKTATSEVKVAPGFVQVIFSNMRSDTSGIIRGTKVTNGVSQFGTKFFVSQNMGGMYSLPGRVQQAQDMFFTTKNNERVDVSNLLVGKTLNIRLTEDEFQDLADAAEDCEQGIGINVVFRVDGGNLNIRELTYQTGEKYNSYTVVAEVVDDSVEECLSTLVSDSLSVDEVYARFEESAKKDNQQATEARTRNQAAREAAANLRDSVSESVKVNRK